MDELPIERTLGIVWDSGKDCFKFQIKPDNPSGERSKRSVLRDMSTNYDPMGFVSPVTLIPKMIMQELWREADLGWDDELPQKIAATWRNWREQIHVIEKLRIHRCVKTPGKTASETTLHTFSDASTKGYGAVVYQRSVHSDGSVAVKFVLSRARVMPIKYMSVPRSELQAAVLGLRAATKVAEALDINLGKCWFWVDSETVIRWINSTHQRYHVFVANCVAELLETTLTSQWRHVPGEINPADQLSRGVIPAEFVGAKHWFSGPDFLQGPVREWPTPKTSEDGKEDEEFVREARICATTIPLINLYDRVTTLFNQMRKIVRVVARIRRLVKPASSQALSVEELQIARVLCGKVSQQRWFAQELEDLKKSRTVNCTSM